MHIDKYACFNYFVTSLMSLKSRNKYSFNGLTPKKKLSEVLNSIKANNSKIF